MNKKCLRCGRDSWRSKYCRGCRNIKIKATSILSQNKNKLIKLLKENKYTYERFRKFMLYSTNIHTYWKLVMEFNQVDTTSTFEKIMKYWTIITCLVSIFFWLEIYLIS